MKIGDLVRLKGDNINKVYLGLIIEVKQHTLAQRPINVRVAWHPSLRAVSWVQPYALEIVSESG